MTFSYPSVTNLTGFTPTAEAILHLPRATSDTASSLSSTASLSSSPTTHKPFFQDPSTATPSPQPNNGGQGVLGKSVLEFAILAVALVIVGCLIFQRYIRLKRNNEPLSHFFSRSPRPMFPSSSSTPFPSHPFRVPRSTGLSDVPPYPFALRTRAVDTDAAGRRLGGLQASDHDGYIGDKDVLPAYDNVGGPPKYRELEMMPIRTSGPGTGTADHRDTGTASPAVVGAADLGAQSPRVESGSHLHSPRNSGAWSSSDPERRNAIPAPAVAHIRE